ncbi:MAG TPA: LysR family transcriptional regulator [Trebonia sp.]|jgi:DNA-binding transcriptional LysR family regulator
MLNVQRLGVLVAVGEEGSFTAAAERLFLSQSAVSQQVAALERETGTELVVRGPQGVRLTPAGRLLAARGKAVIDQLAATEQELRALTSGATEIRLAAFVAAGVDLLPLALRTFMNRRPDTRLRLSDASPTDHALAQLAAGELDVLLMWDYDFAPHPVPRGLTQVHLLDDPMRVVLPLDHPLARRERIDLTELAEDQWIVREHRPPYENAYEIMCRAAGFEPKIAFRASHYQALQGLVAAGIGVSVVPRMALTQRRGDIVTRPLHSPVFTRRVSVVTASGGNSSTAVRELLDVLRRCIEEVSLGIGL